MYVHAMCLLCACYLRATCVPCACYLHAMCVLCMCNVRVSWAGPVFFMFSEFSMSMTIAYKLPTSSENHHSLLLDSLITARLLCTCTASVFVERSSKLHVYPERWREARAG